MNSFPSKKNLSTNSDKILNSRRFKKLCLNSTVNITIPSPSPLASLSVLISVQRPFSVL